LQIGVAIYAVSSCIPHMAPLSLNAILKFILTGKRRNSLKVTAYKEVLRLLAGDGSEVNQASILHEWNRDEVHRDVRIAMITIALRFLDLPEGRGLDVGWKILDSAVRSDQKEILASLLGAKPVNGGERFDATGLTQDTAMAQYVDGMSSAKVPASQCNRYATSVLHKLASAGDDVNDDVRALAIATLVDWIQFCDAK
jgi:hypothetical protein